MNSRIYAVRIIAAAVVLAALLASSPASALDWPFKIEAGDTVITIYMPQIESLNGDMVTGRSAISVSVSAEESPVFGAAWFESYALTDRESRTVVLSDVKIMGARFPSLEGENLDRFGDLVRREIEEWEFLITLDDMNAMLEYVDKQNIAVEGMKNDPPKIYVKSTPAVLILIDGEPKEQDLENTSLKYVVNTAFFIVYDKKSKSYYMRGGPWWYSSKKVDSGYAPIDKVPDEVAKLAEEAEKAAAEDAAAEAAAAAEAGEDPPAETDFTTQSPPEIIISTEPAELIVTEGEPEFAAIEGTELLYMSNTDSDVFMDLKGQQYFTLISGRWYTAPSMEGKWNHIAADGLPADFAKIPPESKNGHVLASVAGTDQARDAVLDMYVPQTAEVDRKEATVKVEYDGEPKFEKVEDTDMTYAVNTSSAVINVGSSYYCCDEAVWFTAAAPAGPWVVCVEVPDAIYTIPPSCPIYNVIYVYVYDYSPDVVYIGYTPGYTCSYVYGGTVVYGTGWYYYPWYGAYYYPRPVTWGYGVHWNPYTGWGFSVGIRFGGPYGWFRVGWGSPYRYWGPRGYRHGYNRGYRHGYRHGARQGYRAGYAAGQRSGGSNNMYKNRSNGVKRTGDVRTGSPSTRQAGNRSNTYADKNGNVYRNDQGNWDKQGGSRDKSAQQPSNASRGDLNNQKAARDKGASSSNQYQRDKSTGQRDTGQKSTGQRDTGQKSTGQRDTRSTSTGQRDTRSSSSGQRSTRSTSSGQRNTRSSSSRRSSGGGGGRRR